MTNGDQNWPGWIIGKKNVLKYLGRSWSTVRRWRKNLSFPTHLAPCGNIMIIKSEVDLWLRYYNEERAKRDPNYKRWARMDREGEEPADFVIEGAEYEIEYLSDGLVRLHRH